jgi:hypothetical protein
MGKKKRAAAAVFPFHFSDYGGFFSQVVPHCFRTTVHASNALAAQIFMSNSCDVLT